MFIWRLFQIILKSSFAAHAFPVIFSYHFEDIILVFWFLLLYKGVGRQPNCFFVGHLPFFLCLAFKIFLSELSMLQFYFNVSGCRFSNIYPARDIYIYIYDAFCICGFTLLSSAGHSHPLSLWILPFHLFSPVFSGTPMIIILNLTLSSMS